MLDKTLLQDGTLDPWCIMYSFKDRWFLIIIVLVCFALSVHPSVLLLFFNLDYKVTIYLKPSCKKERFSSEHKVGLDYLQDFGLIVCFLSNHNGNINTLD